MDLKTGHADLPLHGGKAPKWLFELMVKLAKEFVRFFVEEMGTEEFLKRISDPFWFQSFGCLLGFDWHSSGLTTTVTGALKEAANQIGSETGLFVAGGKGKRALQTPHEIRSISEKEGMDAGRLIYASRISAKVDNTALQDGFSLYHHVIIFDTRGNWAVVQQGMNEVTGYARRYHWFSRTVKDFVVEPHHAVCSDWKGRVLNLVASESEESRSAVTHLAKQKPELIISQFNRILELKMPSRHYLIKDDVRPESLKKILIETYERQPENFEVLLGIKGVGPKTIRALVLLSELLYGAEPSFQDPARFSFAHGGKDGHPFPVDKETYQNTIEFLSRAAKQAKIDRTEREKALKRLYRFFNA